MEPIVSLLGSDPHTEHRLNACSFQQNAILSFAGWQYAAFYNPVTGNEDKWRHVSMARRRVEPASEEWRVIEFTDYQQRMDDGHNTISFGICPGDGTIHLAFDHHCDSLHFRWSKPGLALEPSKHPWSVGAFSSVQSHLPGLHEDAIDEITYPRFRSVGNELLFECRLGKAGEGSDILCHYSPKLGIYANLGIYLRGIQNNPYINGLSYDRGKHRLHVSWTYRHFIEYDQTTQSHAQQAGPNGPENNADLAYAYSDDLGQTWYNSNGVHIATRYGTQSINGQNSITPDSKDIVVQKIPRDSGIMNQEAQCIDRAGNFHVLNRDNHRTGRNEWKHFARDATTGQWSSTPIPWIKPTNTGRRGKVFTDSRSGTVYFLLPGNEDDSLTLLARGILQGESAKGVMYDSFWRVWQGYGFDGEPLIDESRLETNPGRLSLLTTTTSRQVVVLDFEI